MLSDVPSKQIFKILNTRAADPAIVIFRGISLIKYSFAQLVTEFIPAELTVVMIPVIPVAFVFFKLQSNALKILFLIC